MSKSSLFVGLVVSAVIHAVILLPALARRGAPPPPEQPRPPVMVVPPPPAPPDEPEPAPVIPPEPQETVEKEPPPPAPPVEMAEVVSPQPTDLEDERGDTDTDVVADDEKLLPATRIIWESPKQLLRVARNLRMRVVAVDAAGDVAGELILWGEPRLKDFDGRLDVYSNRVRSLPPSFFGGKLEIDPAKGITGFWILVPEGVDRQMADTVRDAVRARGLSAADVGWVEAAFDEGALGGARFVVIEVHPAAGAMEPATEQERRNT